MVGFFSKGCEKSWGGGNLLIHSVGVRNKNEMSHYPTHTFLNYQKSQAKKSSVTLHILHTVFYTFLKVPVRNLCLNIDTVSRWKTVFCILMILKGISKTRLNHPLEANKWQNVRGRGTGWPDQSFIDALIITFRWYSQTLAVAIFCVKVSCQSEAKTCQLSTENNASFKHMFCIILGLHLRHGSCCVNVKLQCGVTVLEVHFDSVSCATF